MPGIIIQKFGGSSVSTSEKIKNVAKIIVNTYKKDKNVVSVVSAQGNTTDELIDKAHEINDSPSLREMDVLLSCGEQISIALLSMAIEKLGFPVVSYTGWQVGIRTSSIFGNARICSVDAEKIKTQLNSKKIVVIAGFQGINDFGDITTLGRGGSDTTAIALASVLEAEKCEIYTDVDGVFTGDPKIVENPKKLFMINYDEMLELASSGAQVLHSRSVEMAKKCNVDLEVKSSIKNVVGTIIKKENKNLEKMLIKGVTKDSDVVKISLFGFKNEIGVAYKTFSRLSDEEINVDVIIQSIDPEGKNISFTVNKNNLNKTLEILNKNQKNIKFNRIHFEENLSKVSIVGIGMISNPGVASKMFEALYEEKINICLISTSEMKITVLVDADDCDKAVQVVHKKFFN